MLRFRMKQNTKQKQKRRGRFAGRTPLIFKKINPVVESDAQKLINFKNCTAKM